MAPTLVLGIIASVLGLGLLYWMGKRKFNRTTQFGTQGFSSYNQRLAIPFVERIARIAGRVLLILGVLFLLSYYWQRKQKADHKTATTQPQAFQHIGNKPKALI